MCRALPWPFRAKGCSRHAASISHYLCRIWRISELYCSILLLVLPHLEAEFGNSWTDPLISCGTKIDERQAEPG
jgi:hypothetical protein